MTSLRQLLVRAHLTALGVADRPRRERGDVPGWVLITLMTALLVTALLAVARPQLVAVFERAIRQVQ